ncbi:MAG: ABC transporter permease [Planctomycetes bacterium GWF2_41_51]|nr:MAG: ABC transporter permease [Planctomycetes bacterium GWF2_41_51]
MFSSQIKKMVSELAGLFGALVVLIIIFGLTANNFFTLITFKTIANQIPDVTIVAAGMTFVLIIAGIDLSVGSVMALCGAVLGVSIINWHLPLWAAIGLCCLTGLGCGLLNGSVIVRWKLPSFIVTLAMLEIARGAAYLVTDSRTIYIGGTIEKISDASVLGISLPAIIAFLVIVLAQIVLSYTVFGRYMVAIGTNEEVVRLSGINPKPIKIAVFAICSLLTAVGAIIQTARLSSANPNTGMGLELQAIAAVVIGGTSLMGGKGSVIRTFLGVLIIGVLSTGLAQIGAQEPTKRLITGLVILAAVVLDYYRNRFRRKDAID